MSVAFIEWNRYGLCGAACAHMVLHAQFSMGATPPVQETIWTSIKAHSNGDPTPQCCVAMTEQFKMVRESCAGDVCARCWWTFPTALQEALIGFVGTGATVNLKVLGTTRGVNKKVKDCLKRGGIPIVLVDGGMHWVVVDGWDATAPEPVSYLDPADAPGVADLDTWNERLLPVECGKYDGKLVVVEVG